MGNKFEDKRDIEIMKRADQVRSLRLAGFTYRQIANQKKISIDTVRRDLERVKIEYPARTARMLVADQNDQLVEMMRPQFLKAAKGDSRAATTMLKLMEHQANLFSLFDVKMDGESNKAVDALNEFFGLLRQNDGTHKTSDAPLDGEA